MCMSNLDSVISQFIRQGKLIMFTGKIDYRQILPGLGLSRTRLYFFS